VKPRFGRSDADWNSEEHSDGHDSSRGVCGIRSGALIVNLPGSPKAVRENFEIIRPVLSHAVALLEGKTAH